jgi:hypothetical protein
MVCIIHLLDCERRFKAGLKKRQGLRGVQVSIYF